MWKVVIGTLLGLGVLVAGGVALVMNSSLLDQLRGERDEVGTVVQLAAVERGDLIRTVSAPGRLEARTLVKVSSQVSAKILALPFREGQAVKAGDVVVRLDPQNLVAILESAQAGLAAERARLKGAEAGLINARLNYERFRQLHETGDVTKSELDQAEAQYLQAQSSKEQVEHAISQADARIEQAQKDLDNTIISSPIDGVITTLNAEVGETVIVGTTNNPGSIILEIADLSEMELIAEVNETNIAHVAEGQQATIYINAYPDREYTGRVRRIGLKRQVTTDGTGIFEVEIVVNLGEGETLLSGLTASTDISVEEFYDVLRVPSQAVLDRRVDELPAEITRGNGNIDESKTFASVVFRAVDGATVVTPVRTGPSDLTHTIIDGGLDDGERVVVGPYRVLVDVRHEQRVRERDEDAGTEDAGAEETGAGDADTEGTGTEGTGTEDTGAETAGDDAPAEGDDAAANGDDA